MCSWSLIAMKKLASAKPECLKTLRTLLRSGSLKVEMLSSVNCRRHLRDSTCCKREFVEKNIWHTKATSRLLKELMLLVKKASMFSNVEVVLTEVDLLRK